MVVTSESAKPWYTAVETCVYVTAFSPCGGFTVSVSVSVEEKGSAILWMLILPAAVASVKAHDCVIYALCFARGA